MPVSLLSIGSLLYARFKLCQVKILLKILKSSVNYFEHLKFNKFK